MRDFVPVRKLRREDAKRARVQRRNYISTVLLRNSSNRPEGRIFFFLNTGCRGPPCRGCGARSPASNPRCSVEPLAVVPAEYLRGMRVADGFGRRVAGVVLLLAGGVIEELL